MKFETKLNKLGINEEEVKFACENIGDSKKNAEIVAKWLFDKT